MSPLSRAGQRPPAIIPEILAKPSSKDEVSTQFFNEAKQKAQSHGSKQNSSFKNSAGEQITWNLKSVVDVSPLLYDEVADGVDLYSRHFRNYQAYEAFEPLLAGEAL